MLAAEQMGRGWIGIDTSLYAASLSLGRLRQKAGKRHIDLKGFPASRNDALALQESDPLTYGVWGAAMLSTVATYQDLPGGLVSGLGSIMPRRQAISISSYVPLTKNLTSSLVGDDSPAAGEVGFVLKSMWPIRPLIAWPAPRKLVQSQ